MGLCENILWGRLVGALWPGAGLLMFGPTGCMARQ